MEPGQVNDVSPEPERYHDDSGDGEDYAPQSIFAAGWFRAIMVLTVLAIVVVVSLPYLLNWFEPTPPARKPVAQATKPAEPAPTVTPSTPVPTATPPAATSPAATAPPAKAAKAADPAPAAAQKPAAPRPASQADKSLPAARPKADVGGTKLAAKVPPGSPKPEKSAGATQAPGTAGGEFWVQLGVFKDARNADVVARAVRDEGLPVVIAQVTGTIGNLPAGSYHVVRAGRFADASQANKARQTLSTKGFAGYVTRGSAR